MIAFRFRWGAALLVAAWAIANPPALAQIKTDGSVGPRRALKGPDFRIDEQLGKRVGDNLFHSFEKFNIRTLGDGTIERATFRGADDIANVISRVTGASPSEINGLLRSEVGKADLWLINPNGVAFGPNARLDVPGSFHVSTADQLRLADGAVFSAVDPDASTLTVAPPEAFGFLGDSAADILVSGGRLQIPDRETLSLSSGRIDIRNAEVRAAEGRVLLTTQEDPGEVRASSGRPSTPPSGAIEIAHAVVDTSGDGGGDVRVNTGELLLDFGSLQANNTGDANAEFGVTIESGSAHLINTSSLLSVAAGSGDAGTIDVRANEMLLSTQSFVNASTRGRGDAGTINVSVDRATITGDPAGPVRIRSDGEKNSTGQVGQINISAEDLEVINGGEIRASSFGAGNGGRIVVDVDGRLLIAGRSVSREDRRDPTSNEPFDSEDDRAGVRSSIRSQIEPKSTAKMGGALKISAGVLEVADEAVLRSATFDRGDAESVSVKAERILVRSGGQISTNSFGRGNSGPLTAVAHGSLEIRGRSATTNRRSLTPDRREPSGIFGSTESEDPGSGDGGTVRIKAPVIALDRFGKITSETFGLIDGGDGGRIEIAAPTRLSIAGSARVTSATFGSGRSGEIDIIAKEVVISSGARIDVSSASSGQPGTITIDADTLAINGDPEVTGVRSEIASRSTALTAGEIVVRARNMRIVDGGEIRTSSFGSGDGGAITIQVEERLLITGRSKSRADRRGVDSENIDIAGRRSSIRSQIEPFSSAAVSGDLLIDAGFLELGDEALLRTATFDRGHAGSVKINANEILIRSGGQLAAYSFAEGNAGNVSVNVRDAVRIRGESASINLTTGRPEPSGIFGSSERAEASRVGKDARFGRGAAVRVTAPVIALRDHGKISSETRTNGDGGRVQVRAADRLTLSNAEITAESAATSEGGTAGDLIIQNTGILELREDARIRTQAESADGGDITIEVSELIDLAESAITTEVGEVGGRGGDGGNIRIDPRFLVLDRSAINASAAEQSAGDITIVANNLIRSPGSDIEATGGPAGIDGRIVLETVEADLVGDLAELPATFLVSERLFDQGCAARSGQPVSSLQRSGRGGLPQMPDAPLGAVLLADKLPDAPDPAVRAGKTEGALDPDPTSSLLDCGW